MKDPVREGPVRPAPGTQGRGLIALWQGGAILLLAALVGISVNEIRSDGIPLLSDWSVKSQLATAHTGGEAMVISFEEAQTAFLSQSAFFLDARPEESYGLGHIEGARSLPWDDFEQRFGDAVAGIPPDALIVTYCDGESCSLSKELAIALLGKGFSNVRVLVNGWTVWQQANLPVEG